MLGSSRRSGKPSHDGRNGDAHLLRRSAADVRRVRAVARVSYEKAVYLDDLTDGAIDVILEHEAKKLSPLSVVVVSC